MKVHTYHCERCSSDFRFLEDRPIRRRCPECENILTIVTDQQDVSWGVTWHARSFETGERVDAGETSKTGISWPGAYHWGVKTA